MQTADSARRSGVWDFMAHETWKRSSIPEGVGNFSPPPPPPRSSEQVRKMRATALSAVVGRGKRNADAKDREKAAGNAKDVSERLTALPTAFSGKSATFTAAMRCN